MTEMSWDGLIEIRNYCTFCYLRELISRSLHLQHHERSCRLKSMHFKSRRSSDASFSFKNFENEAAPVLMSPPEFCESAEPSSGFEMLRFSPRSKDIE